MPWVLVNKIPLFEHDPDLKRYVCAAFAGRKPDSCWEPDNGGAPLAAIPAGHTPAGHTPNEAEA